jgi:hypothetical protein
MRAALSLRGAFRLRCSFADLNPEEEGHADLCGAGF